MIATSYEEIEIRKVGPSHETTPSKSLSANLPSLPPYVFRLFLQNESYNLNAHKAYDATRHLGCHRMSSTDPYSDYTMISQPTRRHDI